MAKTLVVAEKPSVARDLAGALPGSFTQSKDKTHLVGDDYVISWAVGHLVGLAEPDAYDPKLKKWRFADLPIIPDQFKLVPNDERAAKQLKAIHKLEGRRHRPDRQRVRRRARGRAHLRLHLRDLPQREGLQGAPRRSPLDLVDDEAGDPRRLREAAPCRAARAARGCRALPFGG